MGRFRVRVCLLFGAGLGAGFFLMEISFHSYVKCNWLPSGRLRAWARFGGGSGVNLEIAYLFFLFKST